MSPKKENCRVYAELLRVLATYLKRMGIHVTDPDYTVFNRHLLVFITIATLYCIMVLTAIQMAEGDFLETIKALTTFGIFIQVRFILIFVNFILSVSVFVFIPRPPSGLCQDFDLLYKFA